MGHPYPKCCLCAVLGPFGRVSGALGVRGFLETPKSKALRLGSREPQAL